MLEDLVGDFAACGKLSATEAEVAAVLSPWRERLETALETYDPARHLGWTGYRRELERRIAWRFGACWTEGRADPAATSFFRRVKIGETTPDEEEDQNQEEDRSWTPIE